MTRSAHRSVSSVARSSYSSASSPCSNFSFRATSTASLAPSMHLTNLETPTSFTPTSDYWGPNTKAKHGFARQEGRAAPRTACSSRTDGNKLNQLRVPPVSEKVSNTRRTSVSAEQAPTVPSLVRQQDRKNDFVDNLVDFAAKTVVVIWPDADEALPPTETRCVPLDLRTFIQETLKRSRTSYSTLQVALYYLILIKQHVPRECELPSLHERALQSGRRMFLAALILASKYLQDRNFSARAWSKISGLPISEINVNEMAFLTAVNWKLHLSDTLFNRWIQVVLTSVKSPISLISPASRSELGDRQFEWSDLVKLLTPGLEKVHIAPEDEPSAGVDVLSPLSPAREDLYEAYSSRRSSFSSPASTRTVTPTPKSVLPPPRPVEPPTARPHVTLGMSLSNASLSSERLTPKAMGGAMAVAQNVAMSGCTGENWGYINRSETPTLMVTSPTATTGGQSSWGPPRRSSLSVCSSASSPDSLFSVNSRSSSISSASSTFNSLYAATMETARRTKVRLHCETQRLCPAQRIACTASDASGFSSPASSPERTHPVSSLRSGPSPVNPVSRSLLRWTSSSLASEPTLDETPKGFKGRKRSRTNMDEHLSTPSPTSSVNSVSSSPMMYQSLSSSTTSLLAPPSLGGAHLDASSAMDMCVSPADYTSNLTTGMTPQIQMQLQLGSTVVTPHYMMSPGSYREHKRACCEEANAFTGFGTRSGDMSISAMI